MEELDKEEIVSDCVSLIRIKFELVKFPKLGSKKIIIKKGLDLLEKYTPKISGYLAKQKALANIDKYKVFISSKKKENLKGSKNILNYGLKKKDQKEWFF